MAFALQGRGIVIRNVEETSINHNISEVKLPEASIHIFDIYEHKYSLEHAGIRVCGMFLVYNKGIIWLKHTFNYRDLAIVAVKDFSFNDLDATDRVSSCYVSSNPHKCLLVVNSAKNRIEAFTVSNAGGNEVTAKVWF